MFCFRLMMYLTDDEVLQLATNMCKWLKPGGHIFFRESCFHQSGNLKRQNNPSYYRSPQHYNRLFSSKAVTDGDLSLRMVMAKTVDTYARIKGNRNQMCWLWEKVQTSEPTANGNASQEFLDSQQYAINGILRYEKIFGKGFVSTGGKDTTEDFAKMLDLKPGQHVLDVGCGIGGGCFYLAETYGARVLGLDLSTNMVGIALDRSLSLKLDVTFEIADATQCNFPANTFDVVYSRDTILHIQDKLSLFKRFFSWLKPGGRLLISDYCRGEDNETHRLSEEFKEYVSQRGYHLHTVNEYGDLISQAGFSDVQAEDRTWQFVDCLNKELARMADPECRSDFLKEFPEADLKYLEDGWVAKIQRCDHKDQAWGLFTAVKPQ
jgi:phosphoethanolamine N-methyltransferase